MGRGVELEIGFPTLQPFWGIKMFQSGRRDKICILSCECEHKGLVGEMMGQTVIMNGIHQNGQ